MSVTSRFETRETSGQEPRREEQMTASSSDVRARATEDEEDRFAPRPPSSRGRAASFGPFRLDVTGRVLASNGAPLKIGSRALDILITLLEHAPEVVSKRNLIRSAWGKILVDEVSLRVHVTALRKRLGEHDSSVNYITNIPGRGYCFTGSLAWSAADAPTTRASGTTPQLPRQPLLMVGRDRAVREITSQLRKQRFVSVVGAGGIGKTTVALALAHGMVGEFGGAVHYFDLGALEDSRLLASLLASRLHLVAVSDEPLQVIVTCLREQRVLLIFDNCEHLIGAVAALTEHIFREAPQVHILATSREALRAEGEQVHHLPALECPPAYAECVTAAQVLSFPAVQLFVKQVSNSSHGFELTDDDAPIVAQICRRLDGIPLALEFAASRVGAHGVQGTASLLDKHFRLLWRGRRTALPRHQTLGATLDWSYKLLSPSEQLVLRRLAIFVGDFCLSAALEVASEGFDAAELTETLATLVDKSLVTSDSTSATLYRLLETTHAYAWQKLTESGEDQPIARRHCKYLLKAFQQFKPEVYARASRDSLLFFGSNLNDLRSALDWSFSGQGDGALGAQLTGATACLFLKAGLLSECIVRTERALAALVEETRGTRLELELIACSASSVMFTTGNVQATRIALLRALEIAEHLNTASMQFYILDAIYKWQIRSGDLRGFKELTERIPIVSKQIEDPAADAIAHGYSAVTSFLTGNNRDVQFHAEIALAAPVELSKLNVPTFGHLHRIKPYLARNWWVLGYPDRAKRLAEEAINEIENLNHAPTVCYVLLLCLMVSLETGDWQRAEELNGRTSTIATKYNLFTYTQAAIGWEGRIAVERGDVSRGISLLKTSIAALHAQNYGLYVPQLSLTLAEGLAKAQQLDLAYRTICEAVTWAETRKRTVDFIDLLRVRGEIMVGLSPELAMEGESYLSRSFELARQRGLLSLELRCGIRLATLWADRGEVDKGRQFLEPIFGRFSEGLETRDLKAARDLLTKLRTGS